MTINDATNYRKKIKSKEELVAALGKHKGKTTVMCHGCFDIVHPGHIRHLTFAKSKGDILIVSITSDANVRKGHDRPYIPQELRADNLAAFEFVDYVTIDDNMTPIECIKTIKPDIFVKGSEYDGSRPDAGKKTSEEQETVESYGGRMIFSPGDIVFSSTALIERAKPTINVDMEKVRVMLQAYGITERHITDAIEDFTSRRVLVIGDTIVDRYSYCTTLGKTAKTPTLSIRRDVSEDFLGGAAIVSMHMLSLGGKASFVTITGDDGVGKWARQKLPAGLDAHVIVDKDRPTTLKERFWADKYKLLQVDTVDNTPIPLRVEEELLERVNGLLPQCDVLVFSDFRHGLLTPAVAEKIIGLAKDKGKMTVADAQVSNRWGNIASYVGVDLICPNEDEARFALRDQDTGVVPLGRKLLDVSKATYLILKLGSKGVIAFEPPVLNPFEGGLPRSTHREFYPIPAFENNVIDAVGAGDALLSAATLSLKPDRHLLVIAFIANCAGAMAVVRRGNIPLTRPDLLGFATKQFRHIMGESD